MRQSDQTSTKITHFDALTHQPILPPVLRVCERGGRKIMWTDTDAHLNENMNHAKRIQPHWSLQQVFSSSQRMQDC